MLFKLASARETFSWLCKFCSVEQTDRVAVYCQQRAIAAMRSRQPKRVLPILSELAESCVNPIAITPIFDGLDCPQNEHYSTTAYDRRYEKLLGDQIVDLVWHGY
jgi:hypothetical protein